MNFLNVLIPMMMSLVVFAHEDRTPASVGPKKAVAAADRARGIVLSDESEKYLGITFEKLQNRGDGFEVPSEAIVQIMNQSGVYRRREKWLKFIEVTVISTSHGKVLFKSKDVTSADEVVVSGSALVRLADVDAFGPTEEQ